MKKLLFLFTALVFTLNSYGQISNGVYINEVGQKLIISNVSNCCFDFEVTWGVMDEWECLFEDVTGEAKLTSINTASAGEDPVWPEVEFNFTETTIFVWPTGYLMGTDCEKFGGSTNDTYLHFHKQK